MKNITLKVDEETYHRARVQAAEAGTSVSAMVRELLSNKTKETASREARQIEIVTELKKIYAEADERATPRTHALIPPTREEIYAERLR